MFQLVPHGFYYDFLKRRHLWANVSWAAAAISILLFFVKGPNYSIDFTGGTEVEVTFDQPTDVEDVRRALKPAGVGDDAIQEIGDGATSRFLFRMQGQSSAKVEDVQAAEAVLNQAFPDLTITPDEQVGTRLLVTWPAPADGTVSPRTADDFTRITAGLPGVSVQPSPEDNTVYLRLPGLAEQIRGALESSLKDHGLHIERTDSVGPKVGGSLRTAALISLGITMLLLLLLVSLRFDFTFAPGAILCLFHDSAILVGIWVFTEQEFGLSMISAMLTLLGYSINDTIIVYDRIRENMGKYRSTDFSQLINDSINQTLSRTIVTSGATMLSMVPFLFYGGPVLKQFAIAMICGIVVGTYSSIYVAAPLTIILRENRDYLGKLFGMKAPA
ncbi:MAG: protein translocase subunit SecF [Myxococcales bacterium]|nr:protein translocase subunit SecF [Myxococcales bacterium]